MYRNVCQKTSTRTVYIVYVLSQHFPNTQVLCPIRSSQQAPVKWMALGFPCCVHELGPPRWRWSSAVQAGSPAVPGSAYRTKVAKEQTKEQVTWHLTWTKMPKNTQNAHDSHDVHAIRMIYDDLWWFMMIYDSDLWWFTSKSRASRSAEVSNYKKRLLLVPKNKFCL